MREHSNTDDHAEAMIDLIFGWWKSRLIYVGTVLGLFEALPRNDSASSDDVAATTGCDGGAVYRVMRALASIGVLAEHGESRFSITPMGATLRSDAVPSLRDMVLLEASPTHVAFWNHLESVVRQGAPNGVVREYGYDYWQRLERDAAHRAVFNAAMSSYSRLEAASVLDALRDTDAAAASTICDVGGGYGELASALLRRWPSATATILDLPAVVEAAAANDCEPSLRGRLAFVAGDALVAVPKADVYVLKHVLHDFGDDESRRILAAIRRAAPAGARVYICGFVVPEPAQPHFAKLFDVHMLLVSTGRERSAAEYRELLEDEHFVFDGVRSSALSPLGLVEAHVGAR